MRKMMGLVLAAGFIGCALAGCNTIQGAGQDIEEGGEAVQDAAE